MAQIIDGKLVSSEIRRQLTADVASFKEETGITPGLAVILVGNDPASTVYVRNKHRGCEEAGMNSYQIYMPEETTEDELLSKIDELNSSDDVHGILVQLPLPKHISEDKVIARISPDKDVDAFNNYNVGKILTGKYDFLPCTPAGIMELLKYYNVEISGKECVVIGRSNIVGKPMALLLLAANGTVTVCHSRTKDLSEITKRADILVVAIGKANFVGKNMVKDGVIIIDVGINRLPDGKLAGDVNFAEVEEKASMITPVPGGVGPMTITMLLENTLTAAKKSIKK